MHVVDDVMTQKKWNCSHTSFIYQTPGELNLMYC